MKARKLILNYLPPAVTFLPSPALSLLKGFLGHHGYESKTIYWNTLINELVDSHFSPPGNKTGEFDAVYLVPFLWEIAGRYNDSTAKRRILSYFQGTFPEYTLGNRVPGSERIERLKNSIFQLMDSELERMDMDNSVLFGFSTKFYQWIPGMALAEKVKKRFPGIKIAVGGAGNREEAGAIMRICPYIDFAVWGEGEYPLLELLKRLENEKEADRFEPVPRLVYRDRSGPRSLKMTTSRSRFADFQNYIYPDFTDFIKKQDKRFMPITPKFPLEASRGCHWNRCKFCFLNEGYRYRSRSPESIVREVEFMFSKYKVKQFMMMGNDNIGPDVRQFEALLDMLIEDL